MVWTKKARFETLLDGKKADRPIVSGWHHFLAHEQTATDLAEATIRFAKKFDWDWIKINPRATYLAETFGNVYDFGDYEWVFPKQVHAVIQKESDLAKIKQVRVHDSEPLKEQIEAVRLIREGLVDTPIIQTLFSPLTILMFLTGHSSYYNQTMYGSETSLNFNKLIEDNPSAVHRALHHIAETMAEYVTELEAVGVDGLFYATTGTAHPKLFDEATFNAFSRPYDEIVLEAVKKGKTILHTCGPYADPKRFNDYPVSGISWDTKAEGNPEVDVSLKKTKVAGVDHQLFEKDIETIQAQSKKALHEVKDEPFLLVPNCAVSVNASDEALFALRNSVE